MAATEIEPAAPARALPLDGPAAEPTGRHGVRLRRAGVVGARALRSALPDLLALALLALAVWSVFRDGPEAGLVFHEADTSTMFYPVFATLGSALARGELLLWSPELFTGFPLLAEGQTGVLYPPNWLAARLLPTAEGFIWLRIAHFALAALFAYLFGRSLRLAAGSAAILALSFSLGSFTVGQMQHGSVLASAIWLPLVLALTEWGLRARGLTRLRFLLLAGLALGLSALGVHVQTVVMGGACFLAWLTFRFFVPPARLMAADRTAARTISRERARRLGEQRGWRLAWPRSLGRGLRWRPVGPVFRPPSAGRLVLRLWQVTRASGARAALVAWTAATVPLIGAALAAPQLLPLYELSTHSGRAYGWSYEAATDYSLPVPNLLTLLFPFFFRDSDGGGWSLWQPWEVTYYAGVVPLALAALGAMLGRRREALFFIPLVVVSTLLALGDYSPVNLYALVWDLPGVNLQRAPARYSFLGVLGIAALAGLGSQALWDRLRTDPTGSRRGLRLLVVWLAIVIVGVGAVVWHLMTWRVWLEAEPLWALHFLEQQYLGLRHDPGAVSTVQEVYAGLWRSLDLSNPDTRLPLFLLVGLVLVAVCWSELRRARPLWQALLVLLVAVDMVAFARSFHPQLPIESVADIGPAGRLVAAQPGLHRIQTDPGVREPRPNKLLPWGVSEVQAYDPLELSRQRVVRGVIGHVDNWLLDLLGIRYRLLPTDSPGMPSYRQTAFNPEHPLTSGGAFNPAGREAWAVPGTVADELRFVSVLVGGSTIADGEPVGEWILSDSAGRERTFTLVAGRDTAEWSYDDPALLGRPAHRRARVAFSFELPNPLANGARQVSLFYAAFPIPDRPTIRRAEFRQTAPTGRVQVFGFGLFNRERGEVAQFFLREKYQQVFSGGGVVVHENRAAFPRAFAVPSAIIAPGAEDALWLMTQGPFQPRRQVVLENAEALGGEWPPPRQISAPGSDRLGEPYGTVRIVEYRDTMVTVEAITDGGYLVLADAFYPGWEAAVDGQPAEIFRADYLFRAVEIAPGRRLVQFRYEPAGFESGSTIARLTLALVALALLVTLTPGLRPLRAHWVRAP